MKSTSWEEAKRQVHERRAAAGLPDRAPAEKEAAMDRLPAEVRAYGIAGSGRNGPDPEGDGDDGDPAYTVA
ncbi:hypothetical protein ABZ924_28585 [Streptomyces sp. NPDC046876]|uniref:hypothetical protein n=1 Tax=Streptomyces sp. NPDC046876 TaxID=3155616 RepID=UPI003408C0F3